VGNIVAPTIFRTIQFVLSPVALVGYVDFAVRSILVSRRSGVSETALASLYTRWMQHQLGTRLDAPCERLTMLLPNVPSLGLRLTTGPTLLAHRLTGYVPKIYRYPYEHEGDPPFAHEPVARTTFLDAALERHIADVDQLVVLGAGNDTRSYRLPVGTRVRCFEVDTPRTQTLKREMLGTAGVDTSRVTFVAADPKSAVNGKPRLAAKIRRSGQSRFSVSRIRRNHGNRTSIVARIATTASFTISVVRRYWSADRSFVPCGMGQSWRRGTP